MANQVKFCQNCKRDIAAVNYVTHSVHCERNIQLCNLCNEPVPKSEKDEHFEEYHCVEACKLCNTSMEKWQMAKHEEVCIKRLVVCDICKLQLPLDELEEHNDMCGARTEKCPVCNIYVMLKDLDRHRKVCQNQGTSKSQGKCRYCHEIIPWIDMREHEACCCLSTYQSDDEDISKSNVDHVQPTAQKKGWQSDSRPQKKTEDNPISIRKMKQCEYCKERFPDLIITSHLETCMERPYKCELCLQTFPFKNKMKHEESVCPMISGNYNCYAASGYTKSYEKKLKACPFCDKKFPELMFKDHQETCNESPYQCNLCLKSMPLKDKINHDTKECKFKDKKRKPYSNNFGSEREYSFDASVYHRQNEKKLKDCPYCLEQYPELIYREHLEVCDKRPFKCNLCDEFITLKNKTYHDKNECKSMGKMHKQFSGSDRGYSRDVASIRTFSKDAHAYSEQSEKKLKQCPYCEEKYPQLVLIEHLKTCEQLPYQCNLCDKIVTLKDKTYHDKNECQSMDQIHNQFSGSNRQPSRNSAPLGVYTKDAHAYSGQSEKDSLEFNHQTCPYCRNKIPTQRIADHVQLCSENKTLCRFCGIEIPIDDETIHLQNCIGAKHVVDEPVYQTTDQTEFQTAGSKKNKKNKKKDQKQNESPADKGSILSHIIWRWGKDSTSKKDYSPPTQQRITPQFPQVVLLPCEFCDELFPADVIIDHQSGCRPDLTSLPKTEASHHTSMQYSNVHEAYQDRNTKVGAQSDINAYKSIESTGAKPKRYQISRNTSDVKPGEFLSKRITPTKEPDRELDYFNYPSGFPDNAYQMESNASKLNKKLHQPENEGKYNPAVQEHGSQKMSVKNTKTSIFNFSASSNDFRNRSSANQAMFSLPRASNYDWKEFTVDESTELKAVGAERAEKKGIIQISRDTSIGSQGVYSEVSVNHNSRSQDSDSVSNEVYVEHVAKNQLSPSIELPTTSRNSDKKYGNGYSEEKLNISFGEENSKTIETEKVKTTCATRLLGRLENLDLHANITKPWENDCTEDDAKNEETFGNNNIDFDEKFDLIHTEDNFSDSGEHFFDAEDDFKSMEANDSTSSSPHKDSDLDVYFRFLRKGKDELIGPNDMKNERSLSKEENASVCECNNEICYCSIINQPDSLENNNYFQKGTEGATPAVCLQSDLDTYYAFRSNKSKNGEGNIVGSEGQLNSHNAEVEKRSATWNEWRHSKKVETDSD